MYCRQEVTGPDLSFIILLLLLLWFWGMNSEPIPWATPPALFLKIGSHELFSLAGFKPRSS
jgi:hypothetical protein